MLSFAIDPEVLPEERNEDGTGRADAARVKRAAWTNPLNPEDVATIFSLAMPYRSAPRGRVGFGVRREDLPNDAIVDAD